MRKPMISLTESYLFFSRKKIKDAIMTLCEKYDAKKILKPSKSWQKLLNAYIQSISNVFVVSKKITYIIRKTQDRR